MRAIKLYVIIVISLILPLLAAISYSASRVPSVKTVTPGGIQVVPTGIYYSARSGDTLSSIALQLTNRREDWSEIGRLNKIDNDRNVPIGFNLFIPVALLPEELTQAKVIAISGEVTANKADGTSVQLNRGTLLTEGANIRTGNKGFITLALSDASHISLPSNSEVKFSKLRVVRHTQSPRTEIKLLNGRVESQVTPLEPNKGRFEIRSPLGVAGVRGTHFRVGIADGVTTNEVLSGGVAVGHSNKHSELTLKTGQGNVISADSVGKPVALLAAPNMENFSPVQSSVLQITASEVAGAASYRAQIAADQDAQTVLAETRSTNRMIKIDRLPDGDYFVRLTAIDQLGLEGIPRIVQLRFKSNPEPPVGLSPKSKLRAKEVAFSWSPVSSAQTYHLQIAQDPGFQRLLVDQHAISDTVFTTSALPTGRYYWRAATFARNNNKLEEGPFGESKSFDLLPLPNLMPFVDSGAKEVSFKWSAEPGQSFMFQLSQDNEFSSLLVEKNVSEPEVKITRPQNGIYFVRIKAKDSDGYISPFSAPQSIRISRN